MRGRCIAEKKEGSKKPSEERALNKKVRPSYKLDQHNQYS